MHLTGGIIDYAISFWAGVLVSFTPCVYPVLPVTAAFIGGFNATGKRSHGFLISCLYVFGMAIVYSAFGVAAVLTGKAFGQIQNSPIVYGIIAIVMTVFGFIMLDKIQLPVLNVSFKDKLKTRNIWTIVLFGALAGLIVGPCTAPILGSILLFVSSKQSLLHSTSLLFVFSYGVGASLILVGTFSGLLARIPKSGRWLLRVKYFCAMILFLIAGFYLVKTIGFLL